MEPKEAAAADVAKISAALRERVRAGGLTLRAVEDRLGMGRNYLRQLLSGAVDLKLKHLLAVLQVLGESPADFLARVYGAPSAQRPQPAADDPQSRAAIRAAQRSTLRVIVWKLREKGIFSEEETGRMLAQLDVEMLNGGVGGDL